MQVGMFFELQCPRPWREGDELRLFQEALQSAEIGDRIGVAYCWAQEHHFLEEYSHSTAPEVFLAAVSQRTQRMRIGQGVALMAPGYNHPARIAERIATLDLVSGGRVEWGTGESSSRIELEGFELSYVDKRQMWLESIRETTKLISQEPYMGYRGKYFSMPARNVVPKPVQRPHPPLWVACTNRDTVRLAARLGLGALTFAFMNKGEARFWVEEYYEIFRNECEPIGQSVNPNIAMLAGVMCDEDGDRARAKRLRGQQFFKWALAHYYRNGVHVPGRTDLWAAFADVEPEPMAGVGGVGSPDEVLAHFEEFEEAGVDQLIMLQQAAGYRHDDVCHSLELIGDRVLPPILARHTARAARKAADLAPYIERAMAKIKATEPAEPQPVESYGRLWGNQQNSENVTDTRRALDANVLWRMQVGGPQGGRGA